jgi:hypothetical protein
LLGAVSTTGSPPTATTTGPSPSSTGTQTSSRCRSSKTFPSSLTLQIARAFVLEHLQFTNELTGRNQGRAFKSRSGRMFTMHVCCYEAKRPDFKLKTWPPKHPLGSLQLAFALPAKSVGSCINPKHPSLPCKRQLRRQTFYDTDTSLPSTPISPSQRSPEMVSARRAI